MDRLLKFTNRIMIFVVGIALNFDYFTIGSVSLVSLFYIIYFLTAFLYIGSLSLNHFKRLLNPVIVYILLLIFINILNVNETDSQVFPVSFIFCFILFLFALNHLEKDSLAGVFLTSGIMTGGIILSICYLLDVGVEYELGRITLFGCNSNNLGCLMCLTFAIIIYDCIIKDIYHFEIFRFLFILLIVPIVLLILGTASRTAFLALFLVLLSTLFLTPTRKKLTKVFVLITLGISIACGYEYLEEYELMYDRIIESAEEGDASGRDLIWTRLLTVAVENPMGIGQTGYTEYVNKNTTSNDINGGASPHNVPLEIYLYTGFIGLFFMSIFGYRVFRSAWYKYRKENYLLPFLLVIVLIVQMLFGQLLIFRTAWLSFAFICAFPKYSNQDCFKRNTTKL